MITFDDKVFLNELPNIPDINKIKDTDINDLKNGINDLILNLKSDGTITKAGYLVDNKDVYVKVLAIPSLPNNTQTDYPCYLPSNITIDKIESTMYFANGDTTTLPYVYATLINVSTPAYRVGDNAVRIVTTSDRSTASARIKFYFTYNS